MRVFLIVLFAFGCNAVKKNDPSAIQADVSTDSMVASCSNSSRVKSLQLMKKKEFVGADLEVAGKFQYTEVYAYEVSLMEGPSSEGPLAKRWTVYQSKVQFIEGNEGSKEKAFDFKLSISQTVGPNGLQEAKLQFVVPGNGKLYPPGTTFEENIKCAVFPAQ